jgi:hypothetical protein
MRKLLTLALGALGLAAGAVQAQTTNPRPYCPAGFADTANTTHYISHVEVINDIVQYGLDNRTGTVPSPGNHYLFWDTLFVPFLTRSVPVTVRIHHDGSPRLHYVAAWFDFNLDGDFDDRFERVLQQVQGQITNPAVASFDITPYAQFGMVRFRAMVVEDSAWFAAHPNDAPSCSDGATMLRAGETEDYQIRFVGGIIPGPTAHFSATPRRATTADTVVLTDQSSRRTTFRTWTVTPAGGAFIDGTDSSSAEARMRFATPGFYNVKLLAGNGDGVDSLQEADYIEVTQAPVAVKEGKDCSTQLFSPNPADGRIYLTPLAQKGKITILNAAGKAVMTVDKPGPVLPIIGLLPGVYTVKAGERVARLVVE